MQDKPVSGVVIDDQHPQSAQIRACGQNFPVAGDLFRQPCREPEQAAFARFTLHPNLAAHELDELRADGQTQARAAVFARGGAVGLREGLKQALLCRRRNADTGVGDLDTDGDRVAALFERSGAQHHLALFGKFYGVAR